MKNERRFEMLRKKNAYLQDKLHSSLTKIKQEKPSVSLNAIRTERGHSYWQKARKQEFEAILDSTGSFFTIDDRTPSLELFRPTSGTHYQAKFVFPDMDMRILVTYLLVRGPDNYWFVVTKIE